ncbi:MAG: hypothetical protein L3J46_08350 [Kangiellaceae bacterium]|nr:hypothetical protein [Kangiellaceae bacterium]
MDEQKMPEPLKPLRTWSHLADKRRRPSEYDIVTRKFLYNTSHLSGENVPFELDPNSFMQKWYRKYREGSLLKHEDWDAYTDPEEMVYRTYNLIQDGQENYVEGLLKQFSDREHDSSLSEQCMTRLAKLYTPSRYLIHTLQMASIYLGSIAPSASIANVLYFQSADMLRALNHTAYRTVELSKQPSAGNIGKTEREVWEDDPIWQGFRELMEKLLVTYDFSEGLIALQFVAKPAIEECILRELGRIARHNGDLLLGLLNDALLVDSERQRRQARELQSFITQKDGNQEHIDKIIAKWQPLADKAMKVWLDGLLDGEDDDLDEVISKISKRLAFV